jgi:hypothetical protein
LKKLTKTAIINLYLKETEGLIMLYLMKTKEGDACIVDEQESGDFILKAKSMSESSLSSYQINDALSSTTISHFLKDKLFYQATLVSEFENKNTFVEIYKTRDLSGYYQVVANGVIRHPDVDAEGAIRATCFYSNA